MKRDIKMAGNVYLPPGFNASSKYAAIVVVHPGGGVKEQTAGLYAEKMAEQGFVALAFDAAYQGESGGEPRLLEDPMSRVEDISSLGKMLAFTGFDQVDTLLTQPLLVIAGSEAGSLWHSQELYAKAKTRRHYGSRRPGVSCWRP